MLFLCLYTKIVKARGFTYYFNFNFIERVMKLLIGKRHILIDALLGETTLPWVPPNWIPEYFARLMKLSDLS